MKLISFFFYLNTGDCLITVATGPLSDSDADRAGLVSTHAYALLDMRKIQVSRDSYKGFDEVALICPVHCLPHWRTGIESRLACSAGGVVWRTRSPTKPPVSQAKSLRKVSPVYRCMWVLWKCEMNMEIGQVPFLGVFKREKKKDDVNP